MSRLREVSKSVPLALVTFFTAFLAGCDCCPPPIFFPMTVRNVTPIKEGEDIVPVVGDLGGPVDEILSRYRGRTGLITHTAPTTFLMMLNNSTRAFVTDEYCDWCCIDFCRYFPTGGSIYSAAIVGSQVAVGTDQGIAWVSAEDGSWGHYSGAPTSFVISLVPNGLGGVLAGVYYGSTSEAPSVFLCDPTTHACVLSNSGMTNDQNARAIGDFAIVPGSSGSTIFATTQYGNGVFKSTNGGVSWTPCGTGLPQSTSIRRVFAAGGNVFLGTDSTYNAAAAGLYVSTNMGGSWTKPSSLPARNVLGIGGDSTAVYAGVNAPNNQSTATVYKSTDGGSSWQATGSGLTASTINGIAVGAVGVYAATKGGTFRSTDGGATWAPWNRGKNNATVLSLLSANGDIYAGTQGNLSGVQKSSDGGATWTPGNAPIANKVISSLAQVGTTIVGSGSDGTFRSTDGGATWTASSPQVFAAVVASGGNFFGAYALFGSSIISVYKSTDGITWTPANSGTPTNAGATALAAANGTLYAGIGPSVYTSTNGGSSWTLKSKVWAADTSYQISCLQVIDDVLYAGLLGFGAAPETYGFYKSLDGGSTWISIRSGLTANSYAYAIAGIGSTLFAGMQRGLFQSVDGGSSWTHFGEELRNEQINALAVEGNTLFVGTSGRDIRAFVVPIDVSRLVPIVLDVVSGSAHYTTELALTNRGTSAATATLMYTASLGAGSGTATESLSAGQQLIIPDAIAYLRGKGLAIPPSASGAQAGTLLVSFQGLSGAEVAAVTARTTTSTGAPQPVGRAGLAYSALGPGDTAPGRLTVFGLRSNSTDRSNLAVFNMSAEPVTLQVTALSGDGSGTTFAVAAGDVLPPWGWKQYNGILQTAGMTNGWVTVRKTSTTGRFSAYGVINDNGTNDGSFVLPSFENAGLAYVNVPVLVETSSFVSELTFANAGSTDAMLTLGYKESLNAGSGPGGSMNLTLPAGTQRIIPNAIAFLRQNGVAVGPPGGSYAGSLHVDVAGAETRHIYAGARTASPSPAGGQFGLFTGAAFAGSEAGDRAWLYGLQADATSRTNVAVANTSGTEFGGSITLQLQAYDGDAGGIAKGSSVEITLAPGQWSQASGFLAAQGVANGWVKITRTSGNSPWIAYGVVNDGGGPGQGTGDGSYVPMTR